MQHATQVTSGLKLLLLAISGSLFLRQPGCVLMFFACVTIEAHVTHVLNPGMKYQGHADGPAPQCPQRTTYTYTRKQILPFVGPGIMMHPNDYITRKLALSPNRRAAPRLGKLIPPHHRYGGAGSAPHMDGGGGPTAKSK